VNATVVVIICVLGAVSTGLAAARPLITSDSDSEETDFDHTGSMFMVKAGMVAPGFDEFSSQNGKIVKRSMDLSAGAEIGFAGSHLSVAACFDQLGLLFPRNLPIASAHFGVRLSGADEPAQFLLGGGLGWAIPSSPVADLSETDGQLAYKALFQVIGGRPDRLRFLFEFTLFVMSYKQPSASGRVVDDSTKPVFLIRMGLVF